MLRPSFSELMHGLFWLALIVFLVLFAVRAFSMMDHLEKRMQQGNLHHEKIMALADKSLAYHAATIELIVRTHRTSPSE